MAVSESLQWIRIQKELDATSKPIIFLSRKLKEVDEGIVYMTFEIMNLNVLF